MTYCLLIIIVSIWAPASVSLAQYGGGTGLQDDPFLVYTAEQFNAIGANVGDWSKHFRLMNDIDLQGFSQSGIKIIGYPGLFSPLAVAVDPAAGRLYWTDSATGKIQRANMDGSKMEDVVINLIAPFGIALDVPRGWVYWTDLGSDKIQRARLDGSEVEDIIKTGLGTPRGIAIAGDKMYWTDSGQRTLCKANLEGSNVEILVSVGLDRPMGIAVDSGSSRIYWADSDTGKIQRANLDGTHVVDIVSSGLDKPTGIALDVANHRIYWSDWGTDKIQSSALDGTDARDTVAIGLVTPYLMAMDTERGHLYWADRDSVKIQRADLRDSSIQDVIFQNPPFSGGFDGNGKTLFHLTLVCAGLSKVGLFSHVRGPDAQIRNLSLAEPVLNAGGTGAIGILVGQLEVGSIVNCTIQEGTLVGNGDAGGLVGDNRGTVAGCSVTITTTGASGLAAKNSGTISDCHVYGSISRGSGLAGSNDGKIESCSAKVSVDRGSGLVGTNKGMVTMSYANGEIRGQSSNLGGLVGTNKGTVTFSNSDVKINATGKVVGGLVGRNESQIAYSYALGQVAGSETVGGLVGLNAGTVYQCYAVGAVSGTAKLGGLVAEGNGVSQSFWNVEASGQSLSAGGEGYRTVEMQSTALYAAKGWDFVGPNDGPSEVWALPQDPGYPVLWWQLETLPELPPFAGGTGSPEDPYWIATGEQLNTIGCNPRLMKAAFALANDIDLAGVAVYSIGSDVMPFGGQFSGNGYSLSSLSLASPGGHHVGLFGAISGPASRIVDLVLARPAVTVQDGNTVGVLAGEVVSGHVERCIVQDGVVHARDSVGGLIGHGLAVNLSDCHFRGTVAGRRGVGGLIGLMEGGAMDTSSAEGHVTAAETVGGLVGKNTGGRISQDHAAGQVAGATVVGGLIGENDGTIQDCHAESSVTGLDDPGRDVGGLVGLNSVAGLVTTSSATGKAVGNQYVGGLCGENGGQVTKCFAVTDAVGQGHVGGLVGWNFSGTLNQCFSDGTVEGQSRVGGLVGDNSGLCFHICSAGGIIADCYSQCTVTGSDTAGGLAGTNGGYRLGDEGEILRCYATSMLKGRGLTIGGLTGFGSAVSSFWDVEKSALASSAGGSGKTTSQMQTRETFVEAGWDMAGEAGRDAVWILREGEDYPRLQWEQR